MNPIAVVGAGRVGLSLARALSHIGESVTVYSRTARQLPAPLGASVADLREALAPAGIVLLCVADGEVTMLATRVAATGLITPEHVVLHTSGLLTRSALAPLEASGAALGSFHPLQSFNAPGGTPEALAEVPAVIEGDARAVATARELATVLGMQPVLEIDAAGKPKYHAAAVFASNYLVVLADVAARLAREAGIDAGAVLFHPLMRRTLVNLMTGEPASALTGPVRRGDAATVAAHLAALDDGTRELYRLLALEAVRITEAAGGTSAEMQRTLRGEQKAENGEPG